MNVDVPFRDGPYGSLFVRVIALSKLSTVKLRQPMSSSKLADQVV